MVVQEKTSHLTICFRQMKGDEAVRKLKERRRGDEK